RLHLDGAHGSRVEDDDADAVVGGERVDRGLGGLLRHLERQATHRARTVDDEGERHGGRILLPLGLCAYRQEALDGGVLPTTGPVSVGAACEEEAAADL